jgi:hypothetical protein
MARLHVTGGTLVVEGAGPVDPGFGGGIGSGHPDNSLPPGFPPIGSTLPEPPPGVWPPLTPSAPIQPAHPIAGVPVPPGTIWPSPGHPSQGLPVGPGHPDQGLPVAPGHPDQGLPSKTFWIVAGIPGVGWRYVAVDPSLTVGHPLPPTPAPKG